MISDIIYKAMTGIDGYFDTRIVFVSEEGPKDKRVKRLAIMDQDGFNVRALTDGRDLAVGGAHELVVVLGADEEEAGRQQRAEQRN